MNAIDALFPLRCTVLLAGSLFVAACGSSGPSAPLAPGGAATVYIVQNYSTVLAFTASSSGSVAPVATLTPPAGMQILAIATDSSGAIYVGGQFLSNFTQEVAIYAPGASGAAVPVRTLQTSFQAYAMAIDSVGRLYVVGDGSIAVYSATASGTQAPERLLTGTAINYAIAADSIGTIYVSGSDGIRVYAPGTTGFTAPARFIAQEHYVGYGGMAIDSNGDIFTSEETGDNGNIPTVVELGPTATGTSTPLRSFTTASSSGGFGGLQMDDKGNIYVVSQSYTPNQPLGPPFLYGFGPTASGTVEPGLKISSPTWTAPTSNLALH